MEEKKISEPVLLGGVCAASVVVVLGLVFAMRGFRMEEMRKLQTEVMELQAKLDKSGWSGELADKIYIDTGADDTLMREEEKEIEVSEKTEMETPLETYVKEFDRSPLFQVFFLNEPIFLKNVEGVEYVHKVVFERQAGSGLIIANLTMKNDTNREVLPRIELTLFNRNGAKIASETVLYISETLAPGGAKMDIMSFRVGQRDPYFFELRELE